MFGGRRPKQTTLYTNDSRLSALAKLCDRSLVHLPWGLLLNEGRWDFATRSESEYPPELCQAIADAIVRVAKDKGMIFPVKPHSESKPLTHKLRAAQAGLQPRGNLLPPILSEFFSVVSMPWPFDYPPAPRRMLTELERSAMKTERPAKILTPKEGDPKNLVTLGLFRSTDEFVQEACALQHPFDNSSTVPDSAKRAIFRCLTLGREGMRRMREQMFEHYERLAEDLRAAESSLHEAMDKEREAIVRDKRFLLCKHMCADAGVGDDFLADLMMNGVNLTGVGPKPQQFEDDSKKPAISEAQLMRSSRWTRPKLMGSQAGAQESSIRKELWHGAIEDRKSVV